MVISSLLIMQILKLLQGEEDVVDWAKSEVSVTKESDNQDEEGYSVPSVRPQPHHIDLALLEADDDTTSFSSSVDQNNHHSLENYLQERWSRSSSFD